MMKTEETMMMTTESQEPLNNYEAKSSSDRLTAFYAYLISRPELTLSSFIQTRF